jgi:hypothetical protein
MKYLILVFILALCSCTKDNSPNSNAAHAMSADINGVAWFSDSLSIINGNTPNTISSITGITGSTQISLAVRTYPAFDAGVYNFKPAGIDGSSVVFSSFHVTANSLGNPALSWSTSSETNLHSFQLERSSDAVNFATIGTVAATGNSSTIQNYLFTDQAPANGDNFYRLEAVGTDGTLSFSSIIVYDEAFNFTGASYNSMSGYDGTINVANNDTVNHIVTGTFSFDCLYQDTLRQIRNGKFNIHY